MPDRGEDLATVDALTKRLGVLERLAESPAHKRDLVEELDQSRRTIDRAVNELADRELVERDDEGFAATVAGRLALERLDSFQGALDDIVDAQAVLGPLPADAALDDRVVSGSEPLLASDPVAHRPLERLHDAVAAADRYRAVLPALDDPRHVRLLYEHVVTDDEPAELVVSPALLDALRGEFPRRMAAMAETDAFDVRVGEVPPFGLVLLEDDGDRTVYVVVFADATSGVHGVLANDAADAVRWAEAQYDERRADAEAATDALLADPDGGTRPVDVDAGAGGAPAGSVLGQSLPVALEGEGFVRLGVDYFREEPVADPATAWRAGLTLPEVHTGYAVERTVDAEGDASADDTGASAPGDDTGASAPSDDAGASAPSDDTEPSAPHDDADGGQTLTDGLLDRLVAGRDGVLVGPPGSGKSTACKRVACEWYDADRGPVLYREGGRGQPFRSVEDLLVTVDASDGHALVVVEDAVRPDADAVFEAADRLVDRDDVSVLLDAREGEWTDPPGDPGDVSALDVVHMPTLSDRDAERLVEQFERTAGTAVDVPFDRLREEVHDEAAGDDVPDEVLLLLHRLATYADPLADDRTSLEAAVAAVHDGLAGDDLALDVCVLANVLNAAGVELDAGLLYCVAPSGEHEAVDAAVERLAGRVLFPREDGTYRTVHETWSVAFLDHLLDVEGETAAAERFGRCISALLALADDPARCEAIGRHCDTGELPGDVFEDPATWADETAEAVYALGRERPKLAPLFGDGDHDSVTLPDACSEEVVAQRHRWLGQMLLDAGEFEAASTVARRGLAALPEQSREACRLLGIRAGARIDHSEYEAARDVARRQRELAADLGERDVEAEAVRKLGVVAFHLGEYDRADERLQRSLDVAADLSDRDLKTRVRNDLGRVAVRRGAFDEAARHFEESLALAREVGARPRVGDCLNNLGIVTWRQGSLDRAREHLEQSIEVRRAIGDRSGLGASLYNLGIITDLQGDAERAREYFQRSLEIRREVGDRKGEAQTLNDLGLVEQGDGEYDRAREYFQESLDIARAVGARSSEAITLTNLGTVARNRGEYDEASRHLEASADIRRDIGDRHGVAQSQTNLGFLAQRRGEYDRARELHEESLAVARDIGEGELERECLTNLGLVDWRQGDDDRAVERLSEAVDVAREFGDEEGVLESRRCLAAVRRGRGEHDRAREQVEAALALCEAGVGRMKHARVQLERAVTALAGDDQASAREHHRRAAETFDELDATYWRGRARMLEGRIVAASGDTEAAHQHWKAAMETFEDVGTPPDALATLEHLVESGTAEDEQAREWCRRADELLEAAPEPVADRYREWVDDRLADLDAD